MLKKGNKVYVLFLVISIPLLILFLFSKRIFEKEVTSLSENFQQTISLNGYLIKLDNASYNTDTQELKVTAYIKEDNSNNSSFPEIYSISSDYDEEAFMTYRTERNKHNEYGIDVIVDNLNEEFKYIRIFWQSKEADTETPETYDEFGNVTPASVVEGEMQYCYVIIDKVDCQIINSSTSETEPPSTSVLFDEENIQNEEQVTPDLPKVVTTNTTTTSMTDAEIKTKATSTKKEKTDNKNSKTSKKTTTSKQETEEIEQGGNDGNQVVYDGGNNVDRSDNEPTVTEEITTTSFTTAATTQKIPETTTTTKHTTTKKATTTTTKKSTTTKQTTTRKNTTKSSTKATTKVTKKTTKPKQSIPLTRLYIDSPYSGGVINLSLGDSETVYAGYEPINSDATFKWSSNRTDRAIVDNNGKITAVGTGSAIITVTSSDGLSASIMVTVS